MKRLELLIFLCCFSIITSHSFAQDTDPFSYNANIRPSAQAWEMTKYGNLTPSLYTGAFHYSLPIYIYKDEDFEIPISLEYSFNGYRPNQGSGPVGMGWTLTCGGVITREVVCLPDELNEDSIHGFYFMAQSTNAQIVRLKEKLANNDFSGFENDSVFYYCGTSPFTPEHESYKSFFGNTVLRSAAPITTWTNINDLFDASPDIYHFSFMGYSGSFTISPYGEAIVYDTSSPRGEFNISLDLRADGESSRITIATADGYEYYFGFDRSFIDYSYDSTNPPNSTSTNKYFSALKLKKIVAPNGRLVEFDYRGDDVLFGTPFLSVSYYPEIRQIPGQNEIASFYYNGYPKRDARIMKTVSRQIKNLIVDGTEVVSFNYDDRPDFEFASTSYTPVFYGERGDVTSAISLFDHDDRLASIVVKDRSGNSLDSFVLTQSYTSSATGHSPKMFLSSVSSNAGTFSFEYNHSTETDQYPPIDCDATDHWGFWRGTYGRFTFLSYNDIHSQDSSLYRVINHNKDPEYNHTLYSAMTRIAYPSGGFSEIGYEPNVAHKRLDVNIAGTCICGITSCESFTVGGVRVNKIVNSTGGWGSFRDSVLYNYGNSGILLQMPRYIAALQAEYQLTNWTYLPYLTQSTNSYMITWCDSGLAYSQSRDFIGYSQVSSLYQDGSKRITRYTDYESYSDKFLPGFDNGGYCKYFFTVAADDAEAPNNVFCFLNAASAADYLRNEAITEIKLRDQSSARGKISSESFYDANDILVREIEYEYEQDEIYTFEDFYNCFSHCAVGERSIYHTYLESCTTSDYLSGGPVTTTTVYTYNSKGQVASEQTTSNTLADGYKTTRRYWHEIDDEAPAGNVSDIVRSRLRGNNEYITSLYHFTYNDTLRTLPVRKTSYNILTPYPTQTPFTPQTGDSTVVTMSYDSDNHWRPFTVSFPGDAYIQFAWDTSGRYVLSREENGSANRTYYQWQDMVGLSHIIYPTGQGEYYGYDSKNRLCSVDNTWQEPLDAYEYHLVNGGDNLTGGTNFIRKTSYLRPTISYVDISYYDGLGYPIQDVAVGAGMNAGHVVTPKWLDPMRREDARIYLPYPSASSAFDLQAIASQQSWYQSVFGNGEVHNYQEKTYGTSPVGRVLSSRLPGEAYNNHSDTYTYRVNSATDSVLVLSYNASASPTISVDASYAPAGTLACTVTTDADGHITEEYADAFGHVLMSRNRGDGTRADTYYVRDMKDSLICVIQPEGSDGISRGTTLSLSPSTLSECLDSYAFIHTYDARGRLVAKKGPSLEAEEYTYDDRDRLVTSTDGNLRDNGWKIKYEYDIYDCLTRKSIINATTGATIVVLAEYAYDRTGYQCTGANAPPVSSALAFAVVNPGITGVYAPATTDRAGTSLGQKYYEKQLILEGGRYSYGSPKYVERAFYYDNLGRLMQSVESNAHGGITRESFNYDLAGNVVSRHISASAGNSVATKLTAFSHDSRGRVTDEHTYLNGATTPTASVIFTYDLLGRQNAVNDGGLVQADHYALQGWVRERRGGLETHGVTTDIFSETLRRENAVYAVPSYIGRIAETFWMHGGQPSGTYALGYDGFGRLSEAWWYMHGNPANSWSERGMTYDLNGNMKSLLRYGGSDTTPDSYSFSYDGNRLSMLNSSAYYGYDFNGNLTSDASRGLSIGYNLLNLPSRFNDSQSNLNIFCDYLADGTKVAMHREDTALGLAWLGDMVFTMREDAVEPESPVGEGLRSVAPEGQGDEEEVSIYSFESTPYSVGRIEADGTLRKFVTDHLGSVRAVVTDNAVVERSDYYPFGGRHDNPVHPSLSTNRYGFSGKERQDLFSSISPYLDFGARFYDPLTARWLSPDPMADKYTSLTHYNYCGNDPVNFVDPDGMEKIISLKLNPPKSSSYRSLKAYRSALSEYKQNISLKEQIDNVADYDNITILYAHGTTDNTIAVLNNENKLSRLNSQGIFHFLRNNSTLIQKNQDDNIGSIVVLNCCKTGENENSFAAGLSLQLKSSLIIAPSGNSTPDGSVRGFKARWNVFYNGKIIHHFRGTPEDYSKTLNTLNEHYEQMLKVLNDEEK